MGLSLHERIGRFKKSKFEPSLEGLNEDERLAIKKLVEAAKLIDQIYYRQAWSKNEALLKKLSKDDSEDGKLKLELFKMFKGPWDRIENKEPFISDVPEFPKTGNFYPEDLTLEEFTSWVEGLSESDKNLAKGFYTVIKRDEETKNLYFKTYAEEYADLLKPASDLLIEASKLVSHPSLKKFLELRARSFLDQSYLESELAWLAISDESNLEVTCGPYEVYTDELLSIKSAYEMYIHLRDFESSSQLSKFTSSLKFVEDNLPVANRYRNKELKPTPIVVVNQLYASGDVSVPMTAAYNLPNDEEAILKGGSKLVIIKNVQHGKFESVLEPIAQHVLCQEQLQYVKFDAFFTHVLLHEVAHSNGPHFVISDPSLRKKPKTVRDALQELHSALEEAKADITGLFAANLLVQNGTITNITMQEFWTTYLASAFRSIRFGIHEAHGKGQALQLNYLLDRGGFTIDLETNQFKVDFEKIAQAVTDLTARIMILQGDGNKQEAKEFLDTYAVIRPPTEKALKSLEHIPIDINPIYGEY